MFSNWQKHWVLAMVWLTALDWKQDPSWFSIAVNVCFLGCSMYNFVAMLYWMVKGEPK